MHRITRLALPLSLCAAAAFAHEGAKGVVKERMDGMKTIASAVKALSALAKEAAPDPDAIRQHAGAIKAHAGEAMLAKFPDGSLDHPSEARAEIWTDWPRFSELARALENAAEEAARTETPAELKSAIGVMGKTCSSCHKAFRIEK